MLSWPSDKVQELERIKKLAGHNNFSKLILELSLQWLDRQEKTLQDNPIGLCYSESGNTKHWTDVVSQIDVTKIKEDLQQINNPESIGKIHSVTGAINKSANMRSMELWKMTKTIQFFPREG